MFNHELFRKLPVLFEVSILREEKEESTVVGKANIGYNQNYTTKEELN